MVPDFCEEHDQCKDNIEQSVKNTLFWRVFGWLVAAFILISGVQSTALYYVIDNTKKDQQIGLQYEVDKMGNITNMLFDLKVDLAAMRGDIKSLATTVEKNQERTNARLHKLEVKGR